MALPKLDLPIFELKLVSQKDPIKFRPFLVKEEKLLLMALQSGDDDAIYKTIKQVINNCILDEVDIDTIPIFDIEYLFLNIRARSIGETMETYFICRNAVGKITNEDGLEIDNPCTNIMPAKLNILDIKPPISDLPSKINITDTLGIKLQYPTLKGFTPVDDLTNPDQQNQLYDMIYSCTEYIFDKDGVYYPSESSKEEFVDFLESLTQSQFDTVMNFFESIPKIEHDIKITCNKCGHEHSIHLEGLNDFFI